MDNLDVWITYCMFFCMIARCVHITKRRGLKGRAASLKKAKKRWYIWLSGVFNDACFAYDMHFYFTRIA